MKSSGKKMTTEMRANSIKVNNFEKEREMTWQRNISFKIKQGDKVALVSLNQNSLDELVKFIMNEN